MNEEQIRDFWNSHPCGDRLVGELGAFDGDFESFFTAYDQFRYRKERHIRRCLDQIDFRGKEVLEVGLGQGADSEQIIRRGARWSGVDLTPESVARVRTRLRLHELPYRSLRCGSVLALPHNDHSFDIVFSHGVLHHVPDVQSAQRELHRVLKPSGELILMVYAKWSLNYLLSIGVLRRIALLALYCFGPRMGERTGQHLDNARALGIATYLKMSNFIHANTDGPRNPYSKVYDVATVERDFPDFTVVRAYKRFMHAPPLPIGWLPLERAAGWHLWVHLRPRG